MTSADISIIVVIAAYLSLMIVIGVLFSKKSAGGSEEFFLGGRSLGPVVTAMSAEASDMSSWLLMGLPGVAYITGVADAAWTAIGLAVGTYLNWLIVAKRLRVYSEKTSSITVPAFLSARFADKKQTLRGVAAAIIIVFFVPYTASGFAAVGKLFNSLFGFDYMTAMLVGALVIVLYTILGGFLAVSTTDLVQSIVMTTALVAVLIFGVRTAGGWNAVVENAENVAGYLSLTSLGDITTGEASGYGFLTIISTMAWGLGYFGMPHILVRFMGIRSAGEVKIARRIGSIWVIISMAVAVIIGITGYGMTKAGAIQAFASQSEAESVIVKIAGLLSTHGTGCAILAGLILAGILASTMSTSDSQLLAASSSVSEDLLQGVFHINLDKKGAMLAARLTVIIVSILAVFIARNPDSSVFNIVSFSWAGFGATFAPAVLTALFWKRANKAGALAGMVTGGAMVFIWKFLLKPLGGVFGIYELLPAFLLGLLVNIVVTLLTEKPDGETVALFDKVKELVSR